MKTNNTAIAETLFILSEQSVRRVSDNRRSTKCLRYAAVTQYGSTISVGDGFRFVLFSIVLQYDYPRNL